MDIKGLFQDKIFLASAFGVVILGIFLGKKNNTGGEITLKGYDTSAKNDTIFIPTTETHIDFVAGNQTITNTDSRQTITAGEGASITLPKDSTPPAKATAPEKKYAQITATSSIFTALNSGSPIGAISPQRVEVIQQNPSGWMQIKSWKGDVWVKNGYLKTTATAPTTKSYQVQKGDTLWGILGGNKNKIQQTASLNGLGSIHKITAGSTIKIPV